MSERSIPVVPPDPPSGPILERIITSDKQENAGNMSMVMRGDALGERKGSVVSYKNIVTGEESDDHMSEEVEEEEETDQDEHDTSVVDLQGMKVNEVSIGGYDCPEFVLSKYEESRMHRPWRRGVIVKLLGRKIGYKALETRLKQMWVRKGIINIIDVGNDYYLVAFTHEDDKNAALAEGPWFIYDHYLTVKEWSPDFQPNSDTIVNVAVWIRIAGLPIEYYDPKFLHFVGDRVGKTIKVDKNTLQQERGKYARICVEVNITKTLLAMFTIKGRRYKIEYEGLHLLCLKCGKFGHYKEGCQSTIKGKEVNVHDGNMKVITGGGDGNPNTKAVQKSLDAGDGPWQIVQKQRRGRKMSKNRRNNTPGGITEKNAKMVSGSRFTFLGDNECEVSGEKNIVENDRDAIKETTVAHTGNSDEGLKSNDENLIASLKLLDVQDKDATAIKAGDGGTSLQTIKEKGKGIMM
ncbi:uncharacterized protein LOC131633741 [Vicia villosa]|uniref:uncharacterized protein LOC131633741 n=1 Tax=Vicia villosa TaxID=3911 RepID=UPI00273C9F0C|nr:uncharacterized protein LOC131633741 [Vicia villosa]